MGSLLNRLARPDESCTTPFFGANRPGARVSEDNREASSFRGMQSGLKNELDCVKALSETDFTEDLKKFDPPILVIHGDDGQAHPGRGPKALSGRRPGPRRDA
jgi:hypothetical protein